MPICEKLLEIREYKGEDYMPLVDFEAWRVAVLRYSDDMLPENIDRVSRHNETDEVFVLLTGKCILYIADGKDEVGEILAQDLEPLKVYNVKKGVWHHHTVSEDGSVLIVENSNTSKSNSQRYELNQTQKDKIVELARSLW